MNEYEFNCPCCNKKIKIQIQDSELIAVFFDEIKVDDEEINNALLSAGIYLG